MRHKPILFAVLVELIFCLPVQAIILEEEQPKSHEINRMKLKNERKKELQASKKKLQSVEIDMVQLPTGIRIGKYEVTQGQWVAVMRNNNHSKFQFGDNYPVEQVSWDDTQVFIQKLNRLTGKHYRIPTQEEWYLACQAGSNTEYCGSNNIDAVAWYEGNSGGTTHAVGQKQPNAWGLYDMSGNVWEWTSCCEGNCAEPINRGAKSGEWTNTCWDRSCTRHRVSNGGSWFDTPRGVRSIYRFYDNSWARNSSLGFRLAEGR
jgi:formylglycine-generating enzyme required for sulfatase activity